MAVTKMKLVRIMGKLDMLDSAIESCCDSNQFHLDYAMSFFPAAQGFVPINEENPYTAYLEKLKETAATATPVHKSFFILQTGHASSFCASEIQARIMKGIKPTR